jgi:hypothetical protein
MKWAIAKFLVTNTANITLPLAAFAKNVAAENKSAMTDFTQMHLSA